MNEAPTHGTIVRSETLPGARSWSIQLRRGYALRLRDLEGGANCAALIYNADHFLERYNMADTLKAQHTAHLTRGHCCYSDMGRILVAITEDTCGWHDPLCGVSDANDVFTQYGEGSYQTQRNAFHRSGRDLFLVELGKWGLGQADLVANINFFSKVSANAQGDLSFVPGHSSVGTIVELHAEMDTLVVLNTAPHPLDPAVHWDPKPVQCEVIYRGDLRTDHPCRTGRPENARGFANTTRYFCQHTH
jgi:uncharacterized protein